MTISTAELEAASTITVSGSRCPATGEITLRII